MADTRPSPDHRLASAETLTSAIASGQRDAFLDAYTANAVVWHNTDGNEQNVEDVAAGLAAIHERATVSVDVDGRHVTDDGFVQAQRWRFTLSDGTEISFPSLFVARVENGRIARLDEYVDSAAQAPLAEALASPATATPPSGTPMSHTTTRSETIRALFAATDQRDPDAVAPFLTEDIVLRFGNADPVNGKDELRAMSSEFNASLADIHHEIVGLWEFPEDQVVISQLRVHYTRLDGQKLTLHCCNVFRFRDDLVYSYQIFMDINPVFA